MAELPLAVLAARFEGAAGPEGAVTVPSALFELPESPTALVARTR